jgi:hypothetical protein
MLLNPATLEKLNRHFPNIDQRNLYVENLIEEVLSKREEAIEVNNTLTWNNDTRHHVGHIGNDRVEIDGDTFAETEQAMRAQYIEDGLSEEDAEQRAWNELNDVTVWTADVDGVTITSEGGE